MYNWRPLRSRRCTFEFYLMLLARLKTHNVQVTVSTHHYASYRDAANFTFPEQFIPERWLGTDNRFDSDRKDVVQPFSLGPRDCLGKKFVLILCVVVLDSLTSGKAWHTWRCVWYCLNCCSISTYTSLPRVRIGFSRRCLSYGINRHWWLDWLTDLHDCVEMIYIFIPKL